MNSSELNTNKTRTLTSPSTLIICWEWQWPPICRPTILIYKVQLRTDATEGRLSGLEFDSLTRLTELQQLKVQFVAFTFSGNDIGD